MNDYIWKLFVGFLALMGVIYMTYGAFGVLKRHKTVSRVEPELVITQTITNGKVVSDTLYVYDFNNKY